MKNKKSNIIFLALFLSFIGHMIVLVQKLEIKKFISSKDAPVQKRVVKFKVVQKKTSKKNQVQKQRQVVESDEKFARKEKVNTRFLSDKTQAVERETVAKKIDSFNKAGRGVKNGVKKKFQKQSAQKNKVVKNTKTKKMDLSKLGAIPSKSFSVEKKQKQLASQGTKYGNKNNIGLNQSNDFIDDVKLGDITNLNTQEFKYFGFYNRIKKQLEQFWGASLKQKADKLYKSGRTIASNENYITQLIITLDSDGNIMNVQVQGSSGVKDLDDAAIESFNRAGPFPNPPTGMVKNGSAEIKWGFVVRS